MSHPPAQIARDYLIDGLRDAHAMESQAVTLTTTQADRLKHYPDIERRVREHIRETEGQRDRLERCLEQLGSSASTLKDATMKLAANAQMAFHAMTEDEVVKNCLASYAFEHFEIVSYKALIETAKIANEPDILAICQQNLAEEEAMAAWIDQHLPDAVRKYLARSSADVEAKR
jgi:ferritin-like metal-binding protein YciE